MPDSATLKNELMRIYQTYQNDIKGLDKALHEFFYHNQAWLDHNTKQLLQEIFTSISGKQEPDLFSPGALIKVLYKGNVSLFLDMFHIMTKLPKTHLELLFHTPQHEAFAILCKALDMNQMMYSALYKLLQDINNVPKTRIKQELHTMLPCYQEIEAKFAQDTLKKWQGNPLYLLNLIQFDESVSL